MEREPGWYWVKPLEDDQWEPMKYLGTQLSIWAWTNTDKGMPFTPAVIGPRIEEPEIDG